MSTRHSASDLLTADGVFLVGHDDFGNLVQGNLGLQNLDVLRVLLHYLVER